mmetsp:Transcript_37985/g.63864  ORF Transcript_37985/g.63864 Transcript_37985/m.63864 type:complete len:210 (+) Transcript_37985:77-706(+)|eukprot:CAMPEP_0198230552 /NCGR_PEP_ID=MMETSP1445-20131203/114727_1 /TAXON_ID=36898 /ORGANISM="Pyramimonas sp., Strain CCMP2087" /LENGTH=209 /DNA_ID=CAMNT_0043911105 /DNA_START=431 /DNA_END=1060 /DNA_ORIENTATION=+
MAGGAPKTAYDEIHNLYHVVIEDVINNIKSEFQAEGVDDSVLRELETLWRRKLDESGALAPPVPAAKPDETGMVPGPLGALVKSEDGTGLLAPLALQNGAEELNGVKRKRDDGLEEASTAGGSVERIGGTSATDDAEEKRKEKLESEELGSSDDDDDDDDEPETSHLVLAQFDKVNRTKSKWKCNLKDVVLHLNGRDYTFSRANGEFEF